MTIMALVSLSVPDHVAVAGIYSYLLSLPLLFSLCLQ